MQKNGLKTKSGIMVGFGETEEQVVEVFEALRKVDCDMVTVGQYLQPTKFHIAVKEYVHPNNLTDIEILLLKWDLRG